MNRYLEAGYQFHVSERAGVFTVCELIGKGASCAVYRADFTDEHGNQTQHILKEYHPSRMEMDREDSGALVPEDEKKFREGLRRFHSGYEKQLQIRRISGLKNTTSNIQGIYHANGTQYIDMTCFQGQTYDKLREQSVYDLMRRMRALTSVIDNYHKAGFLHLDIKPSNIYTIPETCEMVMLFDFDSVVEKENILSGGGLSYSKAWAAPEQFLPGYEKNICEATDLFAVGEIIFFALFGRHSSRTERRSFAEYSFDYEADIFQNMNPRVFPLLRDLLRHTICGVVSKRYRTAEELLVRLDEIIQLADPKEPYIGKNLPYAESFFVGRDDELIEIHENLQQNRILFLNGIGGIGKSELAKRYAKQYQDCYNSICFAPYLDNVNMLIGSDLSLPICNFTPYPEEKPDDYCARKLRKLNKLCDERTLIIIDNLDRSDDPDLKKLLDLNCKLLITTRVDFSKYGCGQQMQLDVLRNAEDIYSIFTRYYDGKLTKEERPIVDEIIDLVAGHTLTVELIAKQIDAEWATPAEILEKLKNAGVHAIGDSDVDSDKDGVFSSKSTFAHIQALFDLSVFDHADKESELYVLNNLCLFPYTGIDQKLFAEWIELGKHGGKNVVNNLVKSGWIRRNEKNISLHPVVAEVIMDVSFNTTVVYTLFNSIKCYIGKPKAQGNDVIAQSANVFSHISARIMHCEIADDVIIEALWEIGEWLDDNTFDWETSEAIQEYALNRMKIADNLFKTRVSLYVTSLMFHSHYCTDRLSSVTSRIATWKEFYRERFTMNNLQNDNIDICHKISFLYKKNTMFKNYVKLEFSSEFAEILEIYESASTEQKESFYLTEDGYFAILDVATTYTLAGKIDAAIKIYHSILEHDTKAFDVFIYKEGCILGLLEIYTDFNMRYYSFSKSKHLLDIYYALIQGKYHDNHTGYIMYFTMKLGLYVQELVLRITPEEEATKEQIERGLSFVREVDNVLRECAIFKKECHLPLGAVEKHMLNAIAHGYVSLALDCILYARKNGHPISINYFSPNSLLKKAILLFKYTDNKEGVTQTKGYLYG